MAFDASGRLPGLLLCGAVALLAFAAQLIEEHILGYPYLEALVIAILLGTALRTSWEPGAYWRPGIEFSAKFLLELAVMLLGASVSVATIAAVGAPLLIGIVGIVASAIFVSYWLCRIFSLPPRMAVLIACGNSICGNSAIAAVAPVIGANAKDIAASIAFTAVLGVAVVLGLPFLVPILGMSETQYGVLAGLTVYAVPQVLAATLPIGALSNQVGTLVKLVRVLMLGPVVLFLSLSMRHLREEPVSRGSGITSGNRPLPGKLTVHHLVPWFILAFLGMASLRSFGVFSDRLVHIFAIFADKLTTISMAALGLGVDVRVVARAGLRVCAAVTLSLIVLGAASLELIRLLHIV